MVPWRTFERFFFSFFRFSFLFFTLRTQMVILCTVHWMIIISKMPKVLLLCHLYKTLLLETLRVAYIVFISLLEIKAEAGSMALVTSHQCSGHCFLQLFLVCSPSSRAPAAPPPLSSRKETLICGCETRASLRYSASPILRVLFDHIWCFILLFYLQFICFKCRHASSRMRIRDALCVFLWFIDRVAIITSRICLDEWLSGSDRCERAVNRPLRVFSQLSRNGWFPLEVEGLCETAECRAASVVILSVMCWSAPASLEERRACCAPWDQVNPACFKIIIFALSYT